MVLTPRRGKTAAAPCAHVLLSADTVSPPVGEQPGEDRLAAAIWASDDHQLRAHPAQIGLQEGKSARLPLRLIRYGPLVERSLLMPVDVVRHLGQEPERLWVTLYE